MSAGEFFNPSETPEGYPEGARVPDRYLERTIESMHLDEALDLPPQVIAIDRGGNVYLDRKFAYLLTGGESQTLQTPKPERHSCVWAMRVKYPDASGKDIDGFIVDLRLLDPAHLKMVPNAGKLGRWRPALGVIFTSGDGSEKPEYASSRRDETEDAAVILAQRVAGTYQEPREYVDRRPPKPPKKAKKRK